uniref:hypothetical protein n=1 Tax=uncultured Draconibacterium sp. TaxID=1573823 RepID=UPI0032173947
METTKPKVIIDFYKLSKDLQEQVKLVYPDGFIDNLVHFKNAKGQEVSALRFETDDKIYMLRMSVQMAFQILEDDDDYDEDHILKDSVREVYEEKHSDVEYLSENESLT